MDLASEGFKVELVFKIPFLGGKEVGLGVGGDNDALAGSSHEGGARVEDESGVGVYGVVGV